MKGTIIRAHGKIEDVQLSEDPNERLEQMQKAVGGWLELAPARRTGLTAYCNEEGKIRNLPWNFLATAFLLIDFDLLAGDVLILGPPTPGGEDTEIKDSTRLALELIKEGMK